MHVQQQIPYSRDSCFVVCLLFYILVVFALLVKGLYLIPRLTSVKITLPRHTVLTPPYLTLLYLYLPCLFLPSRSSQLLSVPCFVYSSQSDKAVQLLYSDCYCILVCVMDQKFLFESICTLSYKKNCLKSSSVVRYISCCRHL